MTQMVNDVGALKQMLIQTLKAHMKKTILLLAVVGGLITALFLKGCGKPAGRPVLEPGEQVRIEVDGRTLQITTPKGTTRQFVPDTARVTVRDGVAEIHVQKLGVKAELGGGFAVTPNRMKLELDTRIAYAWKFSLHGGLTIDPAADRLINVLRPLVFVAYPLEFKWTPNTSVWAGRELPGEWCGGFRVRF